MRILLLTVAGLSSRFSESVGKQVAKCIYYENDFRDALLSKMLSRHSLFDKIVIVGGFNFDEVKTFCNEHFSELLSKMIFVDNSEYATTGSGLSLCLGLEAINGIEYDEVVFAEGDLFVDDDSFAALCKSSKNIITTNSEDITAKKSVALYFDLQNKSHYIYDTSHGALQINEPFLSIHNSGQIWKFVDSKKLKSVLASLNKTEREGTNLVLINKYFQTLDSRKIEIIKFKSWINCNTVHDFRNTK